MPTATSTEGEKSSLLDSALALADCRSLEESRSLESSTGPGYPRPVYVPGMCGLCAVSPTPPLPSILSACSGRPCLRSEVICYSPGGGGGDLAFGGGPALLHWPQALVLLHRLLLCLSLSLLIALEILVGHPLQSAAPHGRLEAYPSFTPQLLGGKPY